MYMYSFTYLRLSISGHMHSHFQHYNKNLPGPCSLGRVFTKPVFSCENIWSINGGPDKFQVPFRKITLPRKWGLWVAGGIRQSYEYPIHESGPTMFAFQHKDSEVIC